MSALGAPLAVAITFWRRGSPNGVGGLRVEGFFGDLKNEASENLRPSSIRVRGGLETGFLTMLFVVATNFRLAERWDERTPAKKTTKRRGRPRSQAMPEYLAVALSAGRSNGPPVILGKTDDDPMM